MAQAEGQQELGDGAKGGTDRASVVLANVVASAAGTQSYQFSADGMAQVQRWVNGTQVNAGLIIRQQNAYR